MKNYKLSLALAGAFALAGTAFAQVNFTGGGDGTDWFDADNWDSGIVPVTRANAPENNLRIQVQYDVVLAGGTGGAWNADFARDGSGAGSFTVGAGGLFDVRQLTVGFNNDYTVNVINGGEIIASNAVLFRQSNSVFNVDGSTVTAERLSIWDNANFAGNHLLNITNGGSFFVDTGNWFTNETAGWGANYNSVRTDGTIDAVINLQGLGSTFAVEGDHTALFSTMISTISATAGVSYMNINNLGDNATEGIDYSLAFDGDNTTLTVIPEPSTYAFLGGLLALGVVMIRRRLK